MWQLQYRLWGCHNVLSPLPETPLCICCGQISKNNMVRIFHHMYNLGSTFLNIIAKIEYQNIHLSLTKWNPNLPRRKKLTLCVVQLFHGRQFWIKRRRFSYFVRTSLTYLVVGCKFYAGTCVRRQGLVPMDN